jgi:amidophosphoribosyltransferase
LIDDIAEYILQCGEELEISFQLYTKDALRHKLKSGFSLSDCGLSENNSIQAADRVETLLRQGACCLKPVYQLKANDFWQTKRVATFRSEMGAKLAKHLSVESINSIDIVVPVPETGKYYAQGLAKVISKPFVEAIFRNQNMGRGLQIEDAAQRNIFIRKKLTVIEELVKGKNVGIVDEAVFTGATLRIVVDQLKDAGANRIHLLLPTPHNVRACEYNVLPQRNVLLDYIRRTDLKDYFDVDEITFASISDLHNSLGNQVCLDCFDC